MPIRLTAPLLSVDTEKLDRVDTQNVKTLFGMWTGRARCLPSICVLLSNRSVAVFNKCAETLEDGSRLANMSWRIWNRETLCCDSQPQYISSTNLPALSYSIDSAISTDSVETANHARSRRGLRSSGPHSIAGSQPSSGVAKGNDKHITSQGLKNMVHSIREQQALEPLPSSIVDAVPPMPPSPQLNAKSHPPSPHTSLRSSAASDSTAPRSSPDSQRSANRTDESFTSAELHATHSVQRGFSPTQPSSYRSGPHLIPAPISTKSRSHAKPDDGNKHPAFIVGGSSGEDESSLENSRSHHSKSCFLTKTLKPPLSDQKQTSFQDEVESRRLAQAPPSHNEDVFEDSDEESTGPESAIEEEDDEDEDEDGSDWEDDGSEIADAPLDEKAVFQRVDSKPNLVSRRSLLTSQLATESERAAEFARMASNSTPALHRSRTSGPSGLQLEVPQDDVPGHVIGPRYRDAKPITRTSSTLASLHPRALSPRSTRRNMLAQELTETLRKDLLHERQQQGPGRRLNIKRSHTSADLSRPESAGLDANKALFEGYGIGDYHATGW